MFVIKVSVGLRNCQKFLFGKQNVELVKVESKDQHNTPFGYVSRYYRITTTKR